MTAEEYRQRMIQAFHNADCGELVALVVLPTEREFEHLAWLLEKHYKAKPEPCTDAISRQAAIDACLNGWNKDYKEIVKEIRALHPVTPQPKMGRWYSTTIQGEMKVQGQIDGQIVEAFVCSECSAISVFRMADGKIVNGDLCPNCGAKMQEE